MANYSSVSSKPQDSDEYTDSVDTDSEDPPDNQELLDAILSVAHHIPTPVMAAQEM